MLAFLRLLLQALARLPAGFVEGILRILKALWALLLWLFGKRPPDKRQPPTYCFPIPPDVARKPDPCIYSQTYLAAKGMSVTWDNPDIQIFTAAHVPVPSHALEPDTDYLVEATIHNASFDAALGVEVICVYRPWSFGSPDRAPVEADASGNPAVRRVHIGPWGAALATFRWHTPNVEGHYCIQVECHHPDDREPNNNLGQENTNVARPASPVELEIPMWNPRPDPAAVLVTADVYEIPAATIELRLEDFAAKEPEPERPSPPPVIERRGPPAQAADPTEGARIRLDPDLRRDQREKRPRRRRRRREYRIYGYPQRDELRRQNARGAFPLPPDWRFDVAGADAADEGFRVTVPAGATPVLRVELEPPAGAARRPVNFNAYYDDGFLAGGVTVYVEQ